MEPFVGKAAALLGISTPLYLFHMLDTHLKRDLRERFASYVFGTSQQSVADRVMLFHAFLLNIIGRGFWRRALSLLIISVFSIVFIYSLQYLENGDEFNKYTYKYISSLFDFNAFSILVFISFVLVDVVSFFQTLTFSRLAAYCKNVIEVGFLAVSDLVVSFFLVIFILPALIFVSHKLAARSHEATIRVALQDSLQEQSLSIRTALLMAAPRAGESDFERASDESVEVKVGDLAERGWSYGTPLMFIAPAHADVSVEKVAAKELTSVGNTVIFEKGVYSPEETSKIISEIIRSADGVVEVKPIDSYRDAFSNAIYTFDVVGTAGASNLKFWNDYKYLLRDVNFFGDDLDSIFQFGSKIYSENEIMWIGNLGKGVETINDRMIYKCDDAPLQTVSREEFVVEAGRCEKGYAMSAWGAAGIASMLSYKFGNQTILPILPTALSSIFLTFIIYISIIAWVTLPYINDILRRYTDSGADLLVNNQFKIIYALFVMIALPIFLY
ncbi:hypothetical protein [Shinella sedimenti]|uniref:Uncharacterized protein n=1 Tax=Shinella sedimenti TaxID=2919913 RepID=A0ABT0CKF8_9HYPH|nr:hypothetical protein [Shinella sedimenti]MCJ8149102.1 hypothetical protein [Shinella sedimenti]